ncbi:MAG: hypothetical protein WC401_03905 [Bacteroidales bacterium]|nr:hypothetical protein [Bacteroidales bacterium]
MKSFYFPFFIMAILSVMATSCEKSVLTPNMPSEYEGRPVVDQGTIYVTGKNITIWLWDSGEIDGDVVTLVLNDKIILDSYTLEATKKELQVELPNLGYNYLLLFVNSEGLLSQNTAALAIDDGTGEQSLIIQSSLQSSGAVSIYVQ